MVVGWQKPWTVSKETNVQTLIPTIVIFWLYVDFYMLYVDHTSTISRLYVFKKRIIYIYKRPKWLHIVWMMSGNAQWNA
jgi:hypothetical protein